jgi:hypothetical protein
VRSLAEERKIRSFLKMFPADEVALTGTNAPGRQWILLAVVGFALLILAAILALAVRPRVP